MSRKTIIASIPEIRDDNIKDVLAALKNTLEVREGRIGDSLDQSATLRDLVDLGIATGLNNGSGSGGAGWSLPILPIKPFAPDGYNPNTDYTTPPAPTNLTAKGGFTNVYLQWDGAPYRNPSFAEVWRAQVDNIGSAVMIGTTAANVYPDATEPDTTYYYWVRFVSVANIVGPYNQTSGTPATTAINVKQALSVLSDQIQNSQLFLDLGTRIKKIELSSLSLAEVSTDLTSIRGQLRTSVANAKSTLDKAIGLNGSAIISLQDIAATHATQITGIGTRVGTAESSIITINSTTATQASQITSLASTVNDPVTGLAKVKANLDTYYFTKTETNSAISSAGTTLTTTFNNTLNGYVTGATLTTNYYTKSGTDYAISSAGTTLTSNFNTTLGNYPTTSYLTTNFYTKSATDSAISSSGSSLQANINTVSSNITTLEQTKIGYATLNSTGVVFDNNGAITNGADVATWNLAHPTNQATWHIGLPLAYAVKQISITDGTNSLTLESRFTAQKTLNGTLSGQYTTKIDNNGHVCGFGLASDVVDGTPVSALIIRADRFALAGPTDTTNPLGTLTPTTASTPFMVFTTSTDVTLGGKTKTYPSGVWMNAAFIANATIDTAQIKDLTADKITTGNLTANIGITTGRIAGGVNTDYAFGSTNFGTGFFLGLDSSIYKFRVGSYDKNLTWDGTDLTVRGTVYATAGYLQGLTIKNAAGVTLLSAGTVAADIMNSALGALASKSSVDLSTSDVTNKSLTNLDSTAATKLSGIQAGAQVNPADLAALDTTANTKLNGIQAGAQVNPANLAALDTTANTKLAGIQAGAQVNPANLAALDSTANTKLNGIQAGAQVNPANLSALDSAAATKLAGIQAGAQVNPGNLSDLDFAAAQKLSGIEAGATVGATSTQVTALNNKIGNAATNVMASGFFLQTNGYAGGNGLALHDGGLIAKSGGVQKFAIDSSGNAAFAGDISGATGSFAGAVNVGSFTGYGWPAAGLSGAHLSGAGLLIGNFNGGGKYLQIACDTSGAVIFTNIPAYLADAQVSTLKIGSNQVTVPVGGSGYGSIPSSTITLNQPGKIMVMASANALAYDGSEASLYVTATCGGSSGPTLGISLGPSYSGALTAVGYFDVAAGTHTVGGTTSVTIGNRTITDTSLFAIGCMR